VTRHGERETRRRGERENEKRAEEKRIVSKLNAPCLLVSISPYLGSAVLGSGRRTK
jgi:hypothetical protein